MKLGLWTSEGDGAYDAMTEVLLCEESTAWGMTLHTLVETELSSLPASIWSGVKSGAWRMIKLNSLIDQPSSQAPPAGNKSTSLQL